MAKITEPQFEKRYGSLVRAEYADLNDRALLTALAARQPPIVVSRGVLQAWMKRRSIKPADAITVSSADQLQEKYGAVVKSLVVQHPTAYKPCQALKSQTPAIYCSDGIAKGWFKKYGTVLQCIDTAGHLELHCGSRIREHNKADLEAPELKVWLQTALSVDASVIHLPDMAYEGVEHLRQIVEYRRHRERHR